jgi:hypothetical protein
LTTVQLGLQITASRRPSYHTVRTCIFFSEMRKISSLGCQFFVSTAMAFSLMDFLEKNHEKDFCAGEGKEKGCAGKSFPDLVKAMIFFKTKGG